MQVTKRHTVLAIVTLLSLLLTGAPIAEGQAVDEPFTIVVIPDTQHYVDDPANFGFFVDQFNWIADEADNRNIVFVSHEGDLVQNPDAQVEWDRVETAYDILEATEIPYGVLPGNHDYNDLTGEALLYDELFPRSRFRHDDWFGGRHWLEGNRSSYQNVTVGDQELLFIHVRHLRDIYGNPAPVLRWVDRVLGDHPDSLAFITTHEFTGSDGAVLYPSLRRIIKQHCNVGVVFSGHRSTVALGTFKDTCDRRIRHVLTNYQNLPGGGQGFLRTVEIDPATLRAKFEVYSPSLDEYRTDAPGEKFTRTLDPIGTP